ncbi:MAG: ABC transporter substrate-binding protein [Planctomycetota bacterium]
MRGGPLLLLLILLGACDTADPRSGRADRVVSLLPSFTEILVELGEGSRIVACTEHCHPGHEVPRVPWQGAGAAEAILRAGPELVVKQRPRRADDPLRHALERAGVPVLAIPSETIDDVRTAILRIGEAVQVPRRARTYLERFDDEMASARAGSEGRPRPTVLFVFGRDPGSAANITAAGPGSFLDELIRYSGGTNLLSDFDVAYPSVRLETILRRKPEVIIDNQPGEQRVADVWSRYDMVPAVRSGRVFAIKDPQLLIPGPHLPRAVRRMVEMIHGTA